MRTHTTAERELLRGDYAVYASVRVGIVPGFGQSATTYLEHLIGFNPLLSATWTHSMDQAVASGTLVFAIDTEGDSISPLIAASAVNVNGPLLSAGTPFELHTACVPLDQTATPGPLGATVYKNVIDGWFDRVTVTDNGETLTCEFRDAAGYLLNLWIEDETQSYSDSSGVALETILEQIIDGWTPVNYFNVLTPVSPGWQIKQFIPGAVPVWEACRKLALQIGWDLRMRHLPSGVANMVVTLVDPDRSRAVDTTFGPDEYERIEALAINADDVRNVVEVRYPLATGEPLTEPVIVEDAASIATYGRRYMRIVEDKQSNIDTLTEATDMANAALADLKEPLADQSVTLPYFWPLELNDLLEFAANGVHYDAAQTLAAVQFTHSLTQGEGTTTIQARGAPIAAYRDWMRGKPRNVLVSTAAPSGTAPEGTFWVQVESLAFP